MEKTRAVTLAVLVLVVVILGGFALISNSMAQTDVAASGRVNTGGWAIQRIGNVSDVGSLVATISPDGKLRVIALSYDQGDTFSEAVQRVQARICPNATIDLTKAK